MGSAHFRTLRSGIAGLAIMAAAGYAAYSWSLGSGLNTLETQAASRLRLLETALFAPTDKYGYLPDVISAHPLVADVLRHPLDRRRLQDANRLLEQINGSVGSSVIYLLDEGGRVLASSNWREPVSFVGQNYAFRPYFQDAMRKGSGRFYGIGTTSMLPGYYISHDVRIDDKPSGVVTVKVDLNDFDQQWELGAGADEIAVADGNGVIFLSSRTEWKYHPMRELSPQAKEQMRTTRQYGKVLQEPLSVSAVARAPRNAPVARIGLSSDQARPYLIKSGPLPGSDWTIHVIAATSTAEAAALRAGAVGAGTAAFGILAYLYVGQRRQRFRDRERSRVALEQAHQALEKQHGELRLLTEELRISAITDPLTGAYNRRFFFEAAGKLVSAAQRHRTPLSIAIIDIDHFKRINDTYGHPAGDEVLRRLASICRAALREADVFARFGGEEFVIALPHTDVAEAVRTAERLREAVMAHALTVADQRLHVTLSCGISLLKDGEAGIEEALARADDALYIAKQEGRNRVVSR